MGVSGKIAVTRKSGQGIKAFTDKESVVPWNVEQSPKRLSVLCHMLVVFLFFIQW